MIAIKGFILGALFGIALGIVISVAVMGDR